MTTQEVDQKFQLDARLVNAIVNATMDVLGTMVNTQAVFKEVRAQEDYHPYGDLSALITIFGDNNGEGMFALSFPYSLANLLISRFLGIDPGMLTDEDRCDGVGELVNMISGSTKAALSQESGSLYKLSLPTVISGCNHEIASRPKDTPYLILKFEAEGQAFNLQVAYKSETL